MSKQFLVIESPEVFRDAVENHFIPLLQSTYQQNIPFKWVADTVCTLKYIEPLGNGMGHPVVKTIFWDEHNKRADYMEGGVQQGAPVNLN